MKLHRSRISGTGSYLPEELITNKYLETIVDTNDEWIRERTGISSRHKAAPDECTSDLALKASKIALEEAGISPKELDMILLATVTPDQSMPNTACILQDKLGAGSCMALDLSAACSGFVYGLSIADQFIKTGPLKNILVVGAETLSRIVNYEDRDTCILFGDGAGAAVVTRSTDEEESVIYSHHLHADGHLGHLLELTGGGSKRPFSQEVLDDKSYLMIMKGREIFKHAVRTMSRACGEALEFNSMSAEEVDWVIPHQANIRIIEAVAAHFGIPMEKVIVEIEDMGNTSAATVIVALDKAVRDGRIKRGQKVLFTAFGAGVTSGSLLMKY